MKNPRPSIARQSSESRSIVILLTLRSRTAIFWAVLAGLLWSAPQTAFPQTSKKPFTEAQLLETLAAGATETHLAKLVRESGLDFQPSDSLLQTLKEPGTKKQLEKAWPNAKFRFTSR